MSGHVLWVVEMGTMNGDRSKLFWAPSEADARRVVDIMKERDRRRTGLLVDVYYEITPLSESPWPEESPGVSSREEYDEYGKLSHS